MKMRREGTCALRSFTTSPMLQLPCCCPTSMKALHTNHCVSVVHHEYKLPCALLHDKLNAALLKLWVPAVTPSESSTAYAALQHHDSRRAMGEGHSCQSVGRPEVPATKQRQGAGLTPGQMGCRLAFQLGREQGKLHNLT